MNVNSHLQIRTATADETRPLRQEVLRPHQQAHELVYPGDEWEDSAHFVAEHDGQVVGIASIYPQDGSGSQSATEWRLRGMATAEPMRGTGLGKALFLATVEHARSRGGHRYWCNARLTAAGFYVKLGMSAVGEPFTPPGLGPHTVMEMRL